MLLSRLLATVCFVIHWTAAVLIAAAPSSTVDSERIRVALPIYVISIIATAGFVWAVAQYEVKRSRRMNRMEIEIQKIHQTLQSFPCRGQPRTCDLNHLPK